MKKLILIALACSLATGLYANKDGETRTATVKMSVSASDIIDIRAKHTELTVETWNKNEVEVVASIRFDGKMTDRMEEFLDKFEANVKSNISTGAGRLSINTNLDEPNKVQIGSKHVGIIVSYGDKELKVSYKIKAPGSNKYIIANSYEDVRLIGTYNEMEFSQYSGDLEAGTIKSATMNLKYGSATIRELGEADMEIYEQDLNIDKLGTLKINAKYSDLELKSAGKVEAVSYESDYEIGSISKLTGNYKYGEIKIDGKLEESEFTFYEMDVEAGEIGTIRLENSKYSKFDIDKVGSIVFEQSYEDETTIGSVGSFLSENSKYGNHAIDILEGSLILKAYEDDVEIDRLGSQATEISIDGKYIKSSIGVGTAAFILKTNVKYGKAEYDESDVDVKRYVKDNDQLEIEVHSKASSKNPVQIDVKGYEVDIRLN